MSLREIGRHFAEGKIDLLFDAFWQVLPFGTSGGCGPAGYGSNRMNATTVGLTAQGHSQCLVGQLACRIYAANGIAAYFAKPQPRTRCSPRQSCRT